MFDFLKKLFSKAIPTLVKPPPKTYCEHGRGMGHRCLYIRLDSSLPSDLRKLQSTGGTTTWYSRSEGDFGNSEYLRRYGNGSWAIHLGTWCTRANLIHALKGYAGSNGPEWEEMFRAAIVELERRINAVSPANADTYPTEPEEPNER